MLIGALTAFCLFVIALVLAITETNRPPVETPNYLFAALSVLLAAATLFFASKIASTRWQGDASSHDDWPKRLRLLGNAILVVGLVAATMTYVINTDESMKKTFTQSTTLSGRIGGVDRFDTKWQALRTIDVTSDGGRNTTVTLGITADSSVTQYTVALEVDRFGLVMCQNEGIKSRVMRADSIALTLWCSTYIPKSQLADIENATVNLTNP